MKCKVCFIEIGCLCICGFCAKCIGKYGHDECHKIAKKKEGEK